MNGTQEPITIELPAKTERSLRMGAAAAGMSMKEFAKRLFFAGMLSKKELIRSTETSKKVPTPTPTKAA